MDFCVGYFIVGCFVLKKLLNLNDMIVSFILYRFSCCNVIILVGSSIIIKGVFFDFFFDFVFKRVCCGLLRVCKVWYCEVFDVNFGECGMRRYFF